jgi:O-antigen/teichoic acid export membrane protein
MTASDSANTLSLAFVRRRLASGAALTLAGRIAFAASGFVTNFLLARLLSPAELGTYFLIASVVGCLILVAQCGLQVAVVRFVSEAVTRYSASRGYAAALKCARIALAAAGAVALAYALLGSQVASWLLDSRALVDYSLAIAIWVCFAAPASVVGEAFRGFEQFGRAAIFGGLLSNLMLLAAVAALFLFASNVGLASVIRLSVVVACFGASCTYMQFAWQAGRVTSSSGLKTYEVMLVSIPLLLMGLAVYVTTQADLWVAGALLSKAEVAVYGAAARLVQLVLLPPLVVAAVVAPVIARLVSLGQLAELERVLVRAAALGAFPGVAVLAMLSVLAGPLLALVYGAPYAAGASVLVMLSAGQLINALCGPAATVMMMSGHERAVMALSFATAALAVAGAAVLGRWYGSLGIAGAAAFAAAAHGVLCTAYVKKNLGIWTIAGLRTSSTGPRQHRRV